MSRLYQISPSLLYRSARISWTGVQNRNKCPSRISRAATQGRVGRSDAGPAFGLNSGNRPNLGASGSSQEKSATSKGPLNLTKQPTAKTIPKTGDWADEQSAKPPGNPKPAGRVPVSQTDANAFDFDEDALVGSLA